MESKRRIDYMCEEFPAMSAHFAHTLDCMKEKYLKVNFIELDELSGKMTVEDIMTLKSSRANIIICNDVAYEYSKNEGVLYYYVSTTSDKGKIAIDEIIVNVETGEYNHQKLESEVEEAPVDGNAYARKDKEWVKLNTTNLAYSFITGASDKESISYSDLKKLGDYSNPKKQKIEKKYTLSSNSYIWFCSLKPIDYIAHVGGLEIDYKQESNIENSCGIIDEIWYCYRTTYPLLSGVWNFIIKFQE